MNSFERFGSESSTDSNLPVRALAHKPDQSPVMLQLTSRPGQDASTTFTFTLNNLSAVTEV